VLTRPDTTFDGVTVVRLTPQSSAGDIGLSGGVRLALYCESAGSDREGPQFSIRENTQELRWVSSRQFDDRFAIDSRNTRIVDLNYVGGSSRNSSMLAAILPLNSRHGPIDDSR